jgi:hypothetical protein
MTISLAIVAVTVADLLGSATLVAVICAAADAGRSAGAVYTPAALIVPLVAVPPATPLTLQVTLELLALVTVATNACEAPSTTDALPGVTVTLTAGEGGGGGGSAAELAPPPPQPNMHALAATTAARKTKTGKDVRLRGCDSIAKFLAPPLERGRTSAEMQAKGQGKGRTARFSGLPVRAARLHCVSCSNAKALGHTCKTLCGSELLAVSFLSGRRFLERGSRFEPGQTMSVPFRDAAVRRPQLPSLRCVLQSLAPCGTSFVNRGADRGVW